MGELTIEKIQEYLQHAISVETDIATQERIAEQYKANALARKPSLRCQALPQKPQYPDYKSFGSFDDILPILLGTPLLLLGIALLFVEDGLGMEFLVLLVGICFIIPSILKSISLKQSNKEKEKQYQQALSYYEEDIEKIKKSNAVSERKYSNELATWNKSNAEVNAMLAKELSDSRKILDKLYSLDYIYPKYRTLPALTSIYEYLITGRCEGLTGPHGAYNLYEDEVRKDMVISQLSVVIENLEKIKQNQYMLYQQVKEIQQTTSSIENELRQIKGYTVQLASLSALNAYYAALTERNTRITMWCNI